MTRVYLVDDHAIMRECVRALLEAGEHVVVGESADPTEALGDLLRLQPDVLLLDLHLGGHSGFELLAELQRRKLSMRSIVLTASAQPQDVAQAMQLGSFGYVLKESAGSDLMRALESVIHGRKYLGAAVADLALQVFSESKNDDPLSKLSPRERQIIVMVVKGQSSAEIGLELHLSPKSVATYRSRLMLKLDVRDVAGLVRLAIRVGLIDTEEGIAGERQW